MTITKKATVLVLISHYLPGTKSGGPVRTISNLVELLGDEFDFRIITLDHDYGDVLPYRDVKYRQWHFVGKGQVMYLRSADLRPWMLLRILQSVNSDLVFLNGMFSGIVLSFLLLKRLNLTRPNSVVIAPRGHLERGALSIKSMKKRLFLSVSKLSGLYDDLNWQAASTSEAQDILREFKGKRAKQMRVVPNLTSFLSDITLQNGNLKLKKSPGQLRLVFLSRISRKKNLTYALEILKTMSEKIEFDIFGPLENEIYWQECEKIMTTMPPNISVSYRGGLDQSLSIDVLRNYHLFFLPTLGENFGHAILESLCAGCPVLISDRTPWNDINERGAGWALPLEDPSGFRAVVQQIANADAQTWHGYSKHASKYVVDYLVNSTALEDMRRSLIELTSRSDLHL